MELGIPLSKEIGRYLGHHLVHLGNNRDAHKELLKRVNGSLEGWKTKILSREGGIMLAQSVLSSIPLFHMQIKRLLSWLHKELDKAVRRCDWDKKGKDRGIHLLKLETVIKSKKQGGVNLKLVRAMNMALLAKLGWRMISDTGSYGAGYLDRNME